MLKMPSFTRKALNWLPSIKKVGLHLDRHDVELACYFWYVNATKAEKDLGWAGRDPMDTLYDTVDELTKAQQDFAWFD